MKLKLLFLCMGIISTTAVNANCTLPCGVQELLDCAATRQPIPLSSGEELYNQVLFQKGDGTTPPMLDGFCQTPEADLPAGSLSTGLKQYYYYQNQGNYCENADPDNPYYSYAAFINAASAMATKAGTDGVLCCTGSVKDRYIELTSMLATYAQETNGGAADARDKTCISPCRGGLYWRYENNSLLGETINYETGYYTGAGKDRFFVGASQIAGSNINTQQTFTDNIWYADDPDPTKSGGLLYTNPSMPLGVSFYFIPTTTSILNLAPVGNQITVHLTDPSVLYPGLWVGDGPTQLTAESMYFFYGWYENIFLNNTHTTNYLTFVNQYLRDGKLSFIGADWYWMYRVNGFGRWTIHQMMTNTNPNKQVCHGIAAATAMVNGGCNDSAGRTSFYNYFAQILNPDPGGPNDILVPYIYGSMSSTSCTAEIATYCLTAT